MKVFILCGGYGTRLDYEGKNIPKALIKIGRKPILFHLIKIFLKYNFTEFVLCLGYKKNLIENFFQKNFSIIKEENHKNFKILHIYIETKKVKIYFVNTGIKSGTGGRIKIANKVIKNKSDFFMTYCDGLAKINIKNLLKTHKSQKKLATLTAVQPQHRYGVIKISNNRVISLNNNNPKQDIWINGGFFVLKPQVMKFITSKKTFWEQKPLRQLIQKKQLSCYRLNSFWASLDTQKDKLYLNKLWKRKKKMW